jgi:hypothetical protein
MFDQRLFFGNRPDPQSVHGKLCPLPRDLGTPLVAGEYFPVQRAWIQLAKSNGSYALSCPTNLTPFRAMDSACSSMVFTHPLGVDFCSSGCCPTLNRPISVVSGMTNGTISSSPHRREQSVGNWPARCSGIDTPTIFSICSSEYFLNSESINSVASSAQAGPSSNRVSMKSNRYVVSRRAMAIVEARLSSKLLEIPP